MATQLDFSICRCFSPFLAPNDLALQTASLDAFVDIFTMLELRIHSYSATTFFAFEGDIEEKAWTKRFITYSFMQEMSLVRGYALLSFGSGCRLDLGDTGDVAGAPEPSRDHAGADALDEDSSRDEAVVTETMRNMEVRVLKRTLFEASSCLL